MTDKRKYIKHLALIVLLILIDECIKYIFVIFYENKIDVCNMCDLMIHIHPKYNTDGTFLAWFIGQNYNKNIYIFKLIVFNILVALIVSLIIKKINNTSENLKWCELVCDFLLAGSLGRLVERIFLFEYTLDYIYINGIICDLLDVYLTIGEFGFYIICIYFEVKKKHKSR